MTSTPLAIPPPAPLQELKLLLTSQPELYTCEGGLAPSIERLTALAPTRKDAGVDRLLKLFAALLLPGLIQTTSEALPHAAAAAACLSRILSASGAADKNVRLQVCRLALASLEAVAAHASGAEPAAVAEESWASLRLALLPRLRDKQAAVRAAAASAFALLQSDDDGSSAGSKGSGDCSDDSDSDEASDDETAANGSVERDEATLELLRLASGDSSKEVRAAATRSFQLSSLTLASLVERTKDVRYSWCTLAACTVCPNPLRTARTRPGQTQKLAPFHMLWNKP